MSNRGKLVSLLLLLGWSVQTARADRVDDFVRDEMKRQRIPGCSVGIVRNGRAEKPRSYGMANLEQRTRVTSDTLFQIQSMTKSLTAAAVMLLVEEGKIGLDHPVHRYIDGVPQAWDGLTVRHLLTHTSGLKDYINEPTQNLRLEVSDEETLRAAAGRPLNFEPGDMYQYSNTNYLLLGMMIRKVSGKGYGDFLAERIFRPLGMTRTRVYSWSEIIPGRAAGYVWDGLQWRNGAFYAESVLGYPGGGILSTARDLQKWDLALANGSVLREDTQRQVFSRTRLNDGSWSHYGLGWAIGEIAGHPFQHHDGRHSSGFSSSMLRLPEDRLTVIVLTNLAGADTFRLVQGIAAQYVPDLMPKKEPSR